MTVTAARIDVQRPKRAIDASRVVGITGWLRLAAAPTFAALALANALAGPADMLCSAGRGMSPLSGMALMYALMGVFHAGPWLKLLAPWRGRRYGRGFGAIRTSPDRSRSCRAGVLL